MPSWEGAAVGGDSYAESGGPMGDVTEEQVRKWLQDNGLDAAEVDAIMTNATKAHGGGDAKDPGDPAKRARTSNDFLGSEDDDAEGVTRDDSVPDTKTRSGPAPLFKGDRAGQ